MIGYRFSVYSTVDLLLILSFADIHNASVPQTVSARYAAGLDRVHRRQNREAGPPPSPTLKNYYCSPQKFVCLRTPPPLQSWTSFDATDRELPTFNRAYVQSDKSSYNQLRADPRGPEGQDLPLFAAATFQKFC